MYRLLKPLLFCLPAECAHHLTLSSMKLLKKMGLSFLYSQRLPSKPCDCARLAFKNPVGLSAGLDKNGDYIDELAKLGFGFIEIGTVTPKPQKGHKKPRLFRIKKEKALLNRMGFNNKGVDYLVSRVKKRKSQVILGVNIGKNSTTPIERAVDDYVTCFDKVYPVADYITANISSPNTENLRSLQFDEQLRTLLKALKERQAACAEKYGKYKPLFIKVAPDLTVEEVEMLSNDFIEYKIDGVIAANTSMERDLLFTRKYDQQKGGVSGEPILDQANGVLREFHKYLEHKIPLIGVGGIHDRESAHSKFENGATLIQVYTGLIFEGASWLTQL